MRINKIQFEDSETKKEKENGLIQLALDINNWGPSEETVKNLLRKVYNYLEEKEDYETCIELQKEEIKYFKNRDKKKLHS